MATFKVGQRVRIVYPEDDHYLRCATVIGFNTRGYELWDGSTPIARVPACLVYQIDIDGIGPIDPVDGLRWAYPQEDLAPLTDPGAERFIESLKKLAREPQPETADCHSGFCSQDPETKVRN